MNEAPKKILVWDYAADQMVNENPDSTDVAYIRADLVDGLVQALEGMLQAYGQFDESYGGHNHAIKAQTALKALEEE
jgi:hypothetical protein